MAPTGSTPAGTPGSAAGLSAGGRSRRRVAVTYGVLVVVPVVAVLAVLDLANSRHPGRPTSAPVPALDTYPRVLVAIVVVISGCLLVGRIFRLIGQPAVVGEIVTGILLGPSVLGAAWPDVSGWLFDPAVLPQIGVLAQLGVILFAFITGLRLDTRQLHGRGDVIVVVSHVGIALPFLAGVLLALVAYDRFAPDGVGIVPFALLLGVSLSITALPVLARILMDRGMMRTEVGTVALTCALVVDTTAWCALATVVALTRSTTLVGVLVTLGLTVGFVLLMVLVVRPALRMVGRERAARRLELALPLTLMAVFLCALGTDRIGVHSIFGAFVLGLVFPRDNPISRVILEKVSGLTTALLMPLFFAYSGLRTDIGLLGGTSGLWLWCGAILAVAVASKLGGSAVAARALGVGWPQSLQLGALMNTRGLTELIILNVGLDLGLLDRTLFTMLVIMAVLTTAMTTPILAGLQRRINRTTPAAEFPAGDAPPAPDWLAEDNTLTDALVGLHSPDDPDWLAGRVREAKERDDKARADLRLLFAEVDAHGRGPDPRPDR